MRTRFAYLILLSFSCLTLSAQQSFLHIDTEIEDLLLPGLILEHHIKSVRATRSFKYDLDVIKPSYEVMIYEFDGKGRIKKTTEINPFRKRQDSVITEYIRDNHGKIQTMVKNDIKYTYVELFDYEEEKLINHAYYQMPRTKKWNENLYPANQIWSDSMAWEKDMVSVYNKYGIRYRQHRFSVTASGLTEEEHGYDQSGKLTYTIRFEYSSGKISSVSVINNNRYMFDWHEEMTYETGKLTQLSYYKKDALEYVRRITYNNLGLPELDLNRNESSKKMTIIKLEYQY